MRKSSSSNLATLLEAFFRQRLVQQRNASPLTVAAYRDALRLLVLYASERVGREPCALELTDLDREMVLGFLAHLERDRGVSPRTRNARLTAIRSFFRHAAATDPASLAIAQRVLEIPSKRMTLRAPRSLCASDVDALLDAPDQRSAQGRRDYALLLFLARTGARVSEAIGVDASDLRLERPYQVLLRGKGRKERLIPLAADLARTLDAHCREFGIARHEPRPIFLSTRGGRLTRFGATHVLRRAVKRAAFHAPGLLRARISPHLLRHSLAMRLLESGTDLVTIQAWLGHASVISTHRYAEANADMMRRSLDLAGIGKRTVKRFCPKDSVLRILEAT